MRIFTSENNSKIFVNADWASGSLKKNPGIDQVHDKKKDTWKM
jgi:hypothetical protein